MTDTILYDSDSKPNFKGEFPETMKLEALDVCLPKLGQWGILPVAFSTNAFCSEREGDIAFRLIKNIPGIQTLRGLVDAAMQAYPEAVEKAERIGYDSVWQYTLLIMEGEGVCIHIRAGGFPEPDRNWSWYIHVPQGETPDIEKMRAVDDLFKVLSK